MIQKIKLFFFEWKELGRFNKLPKEQKKIVFYAESAADWPHLGPVIEHLTNTLNQEVCYLTSDFNDPLLKKNKKNILSFYVGSGSVRTTLFRTIDAKVFAMTLPDLETYHLKRSVHPVHYVYLFHSINSTHMVYREKAFDAYDTVLCVGKHHVDEIRQTEKVYNLKPKKLVEHGYARLDSILKEFKTRPKFTPSKERGKKILMAPSWGECSLIENDFGIELIEELLSAGHDLTLRLHPMTVRHHPALVSELQQRFKKYKSFFVETNMSEQDSLHQSDLMVSDWSGAAFEYAFGLERPVLFVDTPRKVNNPNYQKVAMPPLEASVRTEIGDVLQLDEFNQVGEKVAKLCSDYEGFKEQLRSSRKKWIYNEGKSASVGANAIYELINNQ